MPDKSISYCHFSLTFDEDKRLVVKDWGSLEGTEVTYNGEGQGKRREFQWIVSGHGVIEEKDSIVINVNPFMSFQIIVAKHDISSQAYIDKVDWFCQGTATAEDLLDDLNFPDRGTERPTGAHTPDTGAIHLRKRLGEGSFGVVTHFWNVSDGSEYALKEPSAKAIRKRKVNVDAWAREARIMGQISHVCLPSASRHPLFSNAPAGQYCETPQLLLDTASPTTPGIYAMWVFGGPGEHIG